MPSEERKVPEMISREAAIAAIEAEQREQQLLVLDLEADSPNLAQACGAKALGIQYAITAIRALPADDRRCANCREWNPRNWNEEGKGNCASSIFSLDDYPITPADHFCAAYQPKEDANA